MINQDQTLPLPGPEGVLTTQVLVPSHCQAVGILIIAHPHPLYGGSMRNKVVTTLARLGRDLGLISITFNFRGVGESSGVYAQGLGEQADLQAIIAWAKDQRPGLNIWLAGFSFGAYVSAAVASQETPHCLISICPPVNHFDYLPITRPNCPWFIVQTDDDEVVSADAVKQWVKTLQPEPNLLTLAEGGHFFHGQLLHLRDKLAAALLSQFTNLCPLP